MGQIHSTSVNKYRLLPSSEHIYKFYTTDLRKMSARMQSIEASSTETSFTRLRFDCCMVVFFLL